MKPGHIRVFDGLRITTEHVNHLQGSLHSAVEDIREIFGLGKVYYGFEVIAEGERAITINPGLAFDFQKNRIVCDEPKTVEVAFEEGEDTKYVCLKYEQIEDGQIEGQFTLIWDSCSVVLQTTLPKVEENLVPIAKLVKSAAQENGTFEVISLILPEPSEETEKTEEEVAQDSESGETSTKPGSFPEAEGTGKLAEESRMSAEVAEETSTAAEGEAESPLEPEAPASHPKAWRLGIQQGVLRLASETERGEELRSILWEPLIQKLGSANGSHGGELLFTLVEKEVSCDFFVSSLTCQTIIHSTLGMVSGSATLELPSPEAEPLSDNHLDFQVTAQGEVSFPENQISQFGVSTIQYYPSSLQEGTPWWTSELTESGIAHLPLRASVKIFEGETPRTSDELLQHLQLLIRVDQTNNQSFKIICHLLWQGGINEQIIQKIDSEKPSLVWEALVAWKAIGESQT